MPKFLEELTKSYEVNLKYNEAKHVIEVYGKDRFAVSTLINSLLFNFDSLLPTVRRAVTKKEGD